MDQDTRLMELSKQLQEQLTRTREHLFFSEILFSSQWFLLLAALIGAYALLWYVIDPRRLFPILFVGLLIAVVALSADGIGTDFLWWDYPHMLMPWGPRLMSADLIIPIGYMLIYQWFQDWRVFFLASLALAAGYSFVLEPFAQYMDIYLVYQWKHLYSFSIYVLLALFAKWAADSIERIALQQRNAA
jgi:hypothetical protein